MTKKPNHEEADRIAEAARVRAYTEADNAAAAEESSDD